MGSIVFAYIVLGSIGVVFPGTIEGIFGISYDFKEIWGLPRRQVETFTLGTIFIDLVVGFGGYFLAKGVRRSLVSKSEV
jgi:hypothetical protein